MAICSRCGGTGGIHGGYKSCYRCSGSGHGGFTNVACMSCGGSGESNEREWNTCWNCGGSGQVADPVTSFAPSSPSNKSRQSQSTATARQRPVKTSGKPAPPWTRANTIAFVLGYIAAVVLLIENEITGWPAFLFAVLLALIVGRFWQALLILALVGGIIWYLAGR